MPEYTVEAIRNIRRQGRDYFALIKWDGYPESDNTWEPFTHLENALLTQYITTSGRWTELLPRLPHLCASQSQRNLVVYAAPNDVSVLDLSRPLQTRGSTTLYPWLDFPDYASWITTQQGGVLVNQATSPSRDSARDP